MIHKAISICIIILVLSCSSDESVNRPITSYFTAFNFQTSLGATRIISTDKVSVIGSSISSNQISLTGLSETGNVLWSKMITITGVSGLSVRKITKIDKNHFMLIASGGRYPVIVYADFDGSILSVSKYSNSSESIRINNCSVTKDGSKICSGSYFEYVSQTQHGLVFEEDKDGTILWAKTINLQSEATSALNESENSICVFSKDTGIIILNRQGGLVSSNLFYGSDRLVFQNLEVIGDNYYAVLYTYQGQDYTILKIDSQGNIIKAIKSFNAYTYNPDISAFESSLFVVSEIESELKIAELDTELNVINETTFAYLDGTNGWLYGRISASANAFNCLINPSSGIPPFGTNGVNLIHALRNSWTPTCKISNPTKLRTIIANIDTRQLTELSIGDYVLQKNIAGFQLTDQVIQVSNICQ